MHARCRVQGSGSEVQGLHAIEGCVLARSEDAGFQVPGFEFGVDARGARSLAHSEDVGKSDGSVHVVDCCRDEQCFSPGCGFSVLGVGC